mgnify:CR=1 FL=1
MTAFCETEEFIRGSNGEKLVAAYLQEHGYYVIPSYDFTGDENNKAPKLQGLRDAHVIPDLDVAKDGRRKWCEVKTKREASFTRKTGRYEHGISERHLRSYMRVQAITGTPVHLVVYEESTGALLMQTADWIAANGRRSNMKKQGRDEGGMVYFPRDGMKQIYTVPQQ